MLLFSFFSFFFISQLVLAYPTVRDANLTVETYLTGLNNPTTMAFLGPDDILVLEKDNGTVRRIQNGVLTEQPVLKVKIANEKELGMLGIDVIKRFSNASTNIYDVFLRFTEKGYDKEELLAFAISHLIQAIRQLQMGDPTGVDIQLSIAQEQISAVLRLNDTLQEDESAAGRITNKLYKYTLTDNKDSHRYQMVGPEVILNLPVNGSTSRHVGGVVAIDPTNTEHVYTTVGDLDISNRTKVQNFGDGSEPDGSAAILRTTSSGKTIGDGTGILGPQHPLDKYFAYGIRNSFGLAFDPLTGNLWNTENGPDFGDEINLVEPGFNSGWQKIMGLAPSGFNFSKDLVNFEGKGRYSDPEFVWHNVVAPTAILFLTSDNLGGDYRNDMFVAGSNNGKIYRFELNSDRTELLLPDELADRVADIENETEPLVFGNDFYAITDMKVGPDGNMYVVSFADGAIYRIQHNNNNNNNN